MKNLYLIFTVILAIAIISISFTERKETSVTKEQFCVDVNCNGKRHYELSPPAFSMNAALEIMRERYPNCKVTGAAKGSCR